MNNNNMPPVSLGVNIDHVATIREARKTDYPSPLVAAQIVEQAGADSITLHLREDRRHIQEHDVLAIQKGTQIPLNLEMAATSQMILFAKKTRPTYCCLVPEHRAELTTEGGLDIINQTPFLQSVCQELTDAGIYVSLFIDADPKQIDAAAKTGAKAIELHTGPFAEAKKPGNELIKIIKASQQAITLGLSVHAGHGLNYDNVAAIAAISYIKELNIGHSIVAHALFFGLPAAVSSMKKLMTDARYTNHTK